MATTQSPPRVERFQHDGLTFRVRDTGPTDGAPVVLLHGFPETGRSWGHVADLLAERGCRVLRPDQRGYSPEARPGAVDRYRVAELAADVVALADRAQLDRFHLAGHDWGGAVAWYVAATTPERLASLTVLSTPHPRALLTSGLTSAQLLRSGYVAFFRTPRLPELVLGSGAGRPLRWMLERSGLAPDDAAATADDVVGGGALPGALAWYRAARLRDLWAVGTVGVPTTYVWGTGDGALGGDAARRTGRWVLAPYRFVVLEGAGHWVHRDRPAAVADAIAARAAPYDGSTASRRGRSTA